MGLVQKLLQHDFAFFTFFVKFHGQFIMPNVMKRHVIT
jgi:hypothetical protein